MPDHILAAFRRASLELENAQKVDRILKTQAPLDLAAIDPTSPAGKRALRGIPVAGGATGTSPGTDPLQALLDQERSR